MTTELLISTYSPVGDIIAATTSFVLLFVIAKALSFSKDRKFVFLKRSLHFIMFGAGSNIAFALVIQRYGSVPWALFLLRDSYHFCFGCCLYCFLLYMKHMLDVNGALSNVISYVTRGFFCLCMFLDFCSPFTHIGLNLENGKWNDSLVSFYNLFYVYTLILLFAMLLLYSNRLIRPVRVCLFATEVIITTIMICQGIFDTNTFSSFTYVMPILVVLILLHSKAFDDKTGSLGVKSFDGFIKQAKSKNISVDYFVLKFYLSVISKLPDELGKVMNSFWHSSFKEATLFHLSTDLYVLAVPHNEKNGNIMTKMNELINHFPEYYEQYKIPYKLVKLHDVDFIDGVDDLLGLLKYLLQIMDDNSTQTVDETIKQQLQTYKKIRDNLAIIAADNNLDDERVLVYCQPIRNMKTGQYDTAEALMRLNLPELGLVMPGMFIELAEEYNHIHVLSKILLNKVCQQIKKWENEGYHFNRISVNFTASEIKLDKFCDEVLGIINSNNVNPSKIGIEITESQTEKDFNIVKKKMEILRNAGITLYLDDVGTGYSNLDRIVLYDVDVVKFDRFFLLEAEKNSKIVKMLFHLSQAFRDLDYKLLYEGVETEAHENLCLSCGADYIQGFKYSKPVPIEEIHRFFTKEDASKTDEG